MSRRQETIIDLSDVRRKSTFLSKLGALTGLWRITIEPHRPRRTLNQNARYWAAVVPAFQTFMRENGQFFGPEEVHEFFLQKFASRNVVDPKTGEVMSVIGSRSSKMDVAQFSEYTDTVEAWMLDKFGVVVFDPEERTVSSSKDERTA